MTFNGQPVQAVTFNGQTVKRCEFNGNVVFAAEISITIAVDGNFYGNTFTATLSDPQALGENDSLKISVQYAAGAGGPLENFYLTKSEPTISKKYDNLAAVFCSVYNASGTRIGDVNFSGSELSKTITGPLYD
jgi:hypothetical protein